MSENAAEQSTNESMVESSAFVDEPKVPELVHPKSIGTQLEEHRESRGWSIEQVAQQLNLAPRQIQALEADNHVALPGMASVRGFIRSYSKLLKIDPEPLLTMISANVATINEPITMRPALSAPFFDDSRLMSKGVRRKLPKSTVLVSLLVVAAIAIYTAKQFGWIPDLQGTAPDMSVDAKLKPVAEPPESAFLPPEAAVVSQPAGNGEQDVPVATSAATPANLAPGPTAIAPTVANTAPSVPQIAAPSAPASVMQSHIASEPPAVVLAIKPAVVTTPAKQPAASVVTAGNGALAFNFREASWVEIRRVIPKAGSPNNLLVYRLFPAGATESINLTEPVTLTIGNAAGVDVSFRGAPLGLDGGKTNVARVTLK